MPRPIKAEIDASALSHNLTLAKRKAPRSRVMAVIKANGYGHGLIRAARALEACDGFAVVDLEEAIRLREAGFRQTLILLEGFFEPRDLPLVSGFELSVVIHHADQLTMLEKTKLSTPLEAFLKINTGMNRLGFAPREFDTALKRLKALPCIRTIALMTHFATADEARGVEEQMACFKKTVGDTDLPVSLANSAALLRYSQTHAQWVRPGIMLYGCSPFSDQSAHELGLRPAMSLRSEIIATQTLKAGECVGYGCTFQATSRKRVGVVACGYADGYPRHVPSGTPVLVGGQRSLLLGRVSMDMLCVDITTLSKAGVGTPVTLWGGKLPVEDVARAAQTISYELLCALSRRVPKVEVGG